MRYLLIFLICPGFLHAADFSEVVAAVTELCETGTSESGSSSRLEIAGEADGEMRVRLIGKAGVAGEVEFTEEEWEGIQQVAKGDQLTENQGRRECVQTLTPLFLSKMQ